MNLATKSVVDGFFGFFGMHAKHAKERVEVVGGSHLVWRACHACNGHGCSCLSAEPDVLAHPSHDGAALLGSGLEEKGKIKNKEFVLCCGDVCKHMIES